MKINLCENVKLSREYTNHSIRATVINNLDAAGFEARHIIQLSSHKSESTIKEYAPKCPDAKKKEMFESLSNAMLPKRAHNATTNKQTKPTSTAVSAPNTCDTTPDIQDVKQNLPTFNLDPIDDSTIDDTLLQELLTNIPQNFDNTNNSNNNSAIATPKSNVQVPVTQNNHQFNTQVINQNIPFGFPRVPAMYFPNSNVTINYNFSK